jgi:hypothetical protein
MTDLTNCCGSAVAAAVAGGVKIAFVTDSPGGIGHFKAPDPDRFARKLFKTGVNLE